MSRMQQEESWMFPDYFKISYSIYMGKNNPKSIALTLLLITLNQTQTLNLMDISYSKANQDKKLIFYRSKITRILLFDMNGIITTGQYCNSMTSPKPMQTHVIARDTHYLVGPIMCMLVFSYSPLTLG